MLAVLLSPLFGGCTRTPPSTPAPIAPPLPVAIATTVPISGPIKSRAQIDAVIMKRYHSTGVYPSLAQMTQIAIDILDKAQSKKTVAAVKDWASDGKRQLRSAFAPNDAGANAMKMSNDWLIVAADARKGNSAASKRKYEAAKKKALALAQRADELAKARDAKALREEKAKLAAEPTAMP